MIRQLIQRGHSLLVPATWFSWRSWLLQQKSVNLQREVARSRLYRSQILQVNSKYKFSDFCWKKKRRISRIRPRTLESCGFFQMSDEGRASRPLLCFKCPTTAKPPASNFSNVRWGQSLSPQLPNVFGWKDLENGPNNNKRKAYDAPIHSGNSGRYLERDAPHFLFYVQEKAGRKIYAPLFQEGADFTPILQTLRGSFSAPSTPMFASKYSLESSRRDLHNALLCTVF